MKDRALPLTQDEVRDVLRWGSVTVRRGVKWPSWVDENDRAILSTHGGLGYFKDGRVRKHLVCPFGPAGTRLWARETWRTDERPDGLCGILYAADGAFRHIDNTPEAAENWSAVHSREVPRHWRPSTTMPRWASRLTLVTEGVGVEAGDVWVWVGVLRLAEVSHE